MKTTTTFPFEPVVVSSVAGKMLEKEDTVLPMIYA